jgi:hypothetical protein
MEPHVHGRCWQQGGYGIKWAVLNFQLARVVCQICWTLSVCWKWDVFSHVVRKERGKYAAANQFILQARVGIVRSQSEVHETAAWEADAFL